MDPSTAYTEIDTMLQQIGLMARGGFYSERRAWQKLHEGFGRGRRASPDASPNQASGRRSGLMKVYWSGAAVALLADVALRTAATPVSVSTRPWSPTWPPHCA